MGSLSELHAAVQVASSLGGIPAPRTFDPSTAQDMPNYEPEPVFSSGGVADELSAAGQRNGYSAAHREADGLDDVLDALRELDDLRNELAARDWTAEQFHAYLREHCPGLIATCSGIAYVHVDCMTDLPAVTQKYEARAKFPDGSPLRHVAAGSWRELAELLEVEFLARKGMGRVPVLEAAAV